MLSKYLAAALLTTALMGGVASAQTTTTNANATGTTMHKEGEWRASKLVGVNVYNDANDKIGDINDVILDNSGKVASVILGVGGFLGMGEHYVAVSFDKLKWVNEPAASTTASTSTAPTTSTVPGNTPSTTDNNARMADGTARTTTGIATSTSTRHAGDTWYPDHAIFNATKDQLKAMQQFNY